MMDYNKTRSEAEAKKQSLVARLKEIPNEKKKLEEEMEQVKRELIGIDQILDGLSFMDSSIPPDFEPSGFTDKVRKILSETPVPLLPTQIRDALEAKGVEGSSSKNLLINVHKVLERIESELATTTTKEGKTAYKRKLPWTEYTPVISRTLRDLIGIEAIPIESAAAAGMLAEPEHPMRKVVGRPRNVAKERATSNKALYGE